MLRFTWLTAPIAGSYGLAQVATEIVKLTGHLASLHEATSTSNHIHPIVHSHVYQHGRLFQSEKLTPQELRYIRMVDLRSCVPQQCYRNAQIPALNLPETPGMDLRYVEGYLGIGVPFPIPHAWLSLNGKTIDLTPAGPNRKRVTGIIPPDNEYYGVELPREICRHILEHRVHISLLDDWQCRWPLLHQTQ